MSEFIAVIGRFTPIYKWTRAQTGVTPGARLDAEGKPKCYQVRLERIVLEPSVSAEEAQKEFLDLTREL